MQKVIPAAPSILTKIILGFIPAWFSVNMGTGIMSSIYNKCPYQFTGLYHISVVFYVLNVVLFIAFAIINLIRYIRFPFLIGYVLKHPSQSLYLGTIPMGLSTIVNDTVFIMVPAYGHWATELAHVLFWINIVLAILTSFGIPFIMINCHKIAVEQITGTWLLPVIPTSVVASSGGILAQVLNPREALIVLIISYCLWGLGLGITFLIMAIYIYRLMLHKLPDTEVIVSAFIPLSPIGQSSYGIQQMAIAGKKVFPEINFLKDSNSGEVIYIISTLVGLLLWGLGLWWFFHGITAVVTRFKSGKIKFNMGFWAFIFPIGVFVTATISLGNAIPSAFFKILAVVLIIGLTILYLCVAGMTLYKAINRTIFVAPDLTQVQQSETNIA